MKNIFSMDNKFFTFMSKVADIMILNLLFIATSIPVVTIGASITALYSVTLKQVDGKDPYICREYFSAWVKNFKQSTILWLFVMFSGILFWLNFNVVTSTGISVIFAILMVIAIVVLVLILLYLFPLIAKFNNTLPNMVVNSLFLAVRHLLTTIMMAVTNGFFLYLTISYPQIIAQISMFWFLFGFALVAKIQSSYLHGVFSQHLPKEESDVENPDSENTDGNDCISEIDACAAETEV